MNLYILFFFFISLAVSKNTLSLKPSDGESHVAPSVPNVTPTKATPRFIPFDCQADADCKGNSKGPFCVNHICTKSRPASTKSEPEDPICHSAADCQGGFCYNGICVAELPSSMMRFARRAPQADPRCHNDAECQGGYCYNGICVAEPPKFGSLEE